MWGYRLISLAGLAVMIGIAWAMSENRRKFPVRVAVWGLALQFALALFVLRTQFGYRVFDAANRAFNALTESSDEGAKFVFGVLAKDPAYGALVGFHVLPVIIFVAALSAVLYHFGAVQAVVRGMAWVMRKTMRISGAEALASALQVFLGIEAMPATDEYIRRMTRSEIFVVMTAFMGTIAGSVMVAYMSFGAEAGHLLTASLMSAPAAIVIAKVMIPETGRPLTAGNVEFRPRRIHVNAVDAAAGGAAEGVRLAIDIGAMLVAFVGLIYFVNLILHAVAGVTLQQVMGWVFYPFAALLGVVPEDCGGVSRLLGVKTVINEFVAYADFSAIRGQLHPRSAAIVTYALCGFANPGSIAILIGGLGGIDPQRRGTYAALGVRSLVSGTLTTFMTACIAGVLI